MYRAQGRGAPRITHAGRCGLKVGEFPENWSVASCVGPVSLKLCRISRCPKRIASRLLDLISMLSDHLLSIWPTINSDRRSSS